MYCICTIVVKFSVLDHSLVSPTTSVCLFVKDLEKGREYEKTVRQYERILGSCGLVQPIEVGDQIMRLHPALLYNYNIGAGLC